STPTALASRCRSRRILFSNPRKLTPEPPPEVDVIDAPLLRTLVEQLEALPPPYLVSLKVPRPIRDPNLKPAI
ncbi:MAG: hypothetical protein Q6K70_09490, partial [Thermostichales cyanobacterium DRC_bins_46]